MLPVYDPHLSLRLLDEVVQWKTQEMEQITFVRARIPELEEPYVQLMSDWENVFMKTRDLALHTKNALLTVPDLNLSSSWSPQLPALLASAQTQSQEFSRQLQLLPQHSKAVAQSPDSQLILSSNLQHASDKSEVTWSNPTGEAPIVSNSEIKPLAALNNPVPIGEHKLPPLPYSYKALEPYIDEKTMRIHHDKHHQSYVDGLNKAEKKLQEARQSGDFELVKHWERELAFNGAGHYLHTLFWNVMSPKGGGKPQNELLEEINRSFGSYDAFKKQFTEAANKVEGGGWAILVWSPRSHRLEVLTAEKHQNLSQWDVIPLLPLDVWEHAYYLKHQNDRASYTKDWWNVVNWPYVAERFATASTIRWEPY